MTEASATHHSSKPIVILGAGGFAREIAQLIRDINAGGRDIWTIVGFWDKDTGRHGQTLNGVPILGSEELKRYLPDLSATAAIGDPKIKSRAVEEAVELGCAFPSLVHPRVVYDQSTVDIGPGSIICAGNILTVNISIGAHVIVNLDCTIGHDCAIEDFVTVSPGCHLSGNSIVRQGAFLGTGAVLVEKREIGEYSTVGAGAVVTKNIPPNATAVGVPARPLKD